jgi:hypothetical protein
MILRIVQRADQQTRRDSVEGFSFLGGLGIQQIPGITWRRRRCAARGRESGEVSLYESSRAAVLDAELREHHQRAGRRWCRLLALVSLQSAAKARGTSSPSVQRPVKEWQAGECRCWNNRFLIGVHLRIDRSTCNFIAVTNCGACR